MGLTLYTGSSLLAFLACIILAPLVLWRGKPGRQTYLFSGLTLLVGVWSLFPFVTGRVERGADALAAARLLYLAALFVPPIFLHLTYAILGLSTMRREAALLRGFYLVSTVFALVLPTEWFIRDVIRYAPFFCVVRGPLYTAYVAFFGATCALGFVALLRGTGARPGFGAISCGISSCPGSWRTSPACFISCPPISASSPSRTISWSSRL